MGSLLVLFCNAGILLAYILGNFVDYTTFPIIFLIFPIVFFIGFIFFPETPQYLFKSGDEMVITITYILNAKIVTSYANTGCRKITTLLSQHKTTILPTGSRIIKSGNVQIQELL